MEPDQTLLHGMDDNAELFSRQELCLYGSRIFQGPQWRMPNRSDKTGNSVLLEVK